MKPLAIDLFCGLGGWTDGLIAEGYRVVGFDVEAHEYDGERYPAELVLEDVLAIDGARFADATLIVASPPCQEYSYMAMPWKRAKDKAAAIRADETGEELARLNRLFDACFRIQREASAAAGRHIPMVVENVRGAIPWVGRSRWNFGSFHLWGDVPALMPVALRDVAGQKGEGGSWFGVDGRGNPTDPANPARGAAIGEGRKQPGISGKRENGKGDKWFQDGAAANSSGSAARKAASARIAKIPLSLSRHIARTYRDDASNTRNENGLQSPRVTEAAVPGADAGTDGEILNVAGVRNGE